MIKLSVNINKVATLRNARGGKIPDLLSFARDCEAMGVDGITIHPRPDERHITTQDVYDLKGVITKEWNIEGYPEERFMKLLETIRPNQATLVPDSPRDITSNRGWNTVENQDLLINVVERLKSWGTRVAIFVEPDPKMVEGAKHCGADRVELYTGHYAHCFKDVTKKKEVLEKYLEASLVAQDLKMGLNAGHDLSLVNLPDFVKKIKNLKEVSIGHALICESLYLGIENCIHSYLRILER